MRGKREGRWPAPGFHVPQLAELGIETRRWWGGGAHKHAAIAFMPRADLPVTERLAASTLGLPLYRDMSDKDIDAVVPALLRRNR